MGIAHDVALLNLAILLEKTGDLLFGKTGMDSCHEEVGARVASTRVFILVWTASSGLRRRASARMVSACFAKEG